MQNLISWKIGGEQGQGIDSSGDLFATVCNRLGYYVYGYKEFSSRIKGGHSNYKIRVGVEPVGSTSDDLHFLVAIDQETIDRNHHELVPGGFVVADDGDRGEASRGEGRGFLEVPMTEIANEMGNPRVKNVVFLGRDRLYFGVPVEAFPTFCPALWPPRQGSRRSKRGRASAGLRVRAGARLGDALEAGLPTVNPGFS